MFRHSPSHITSAAKLILRRKKYKENLVAKTSQQIENLQEMVDTIEFASIEVCNSILHLLVSVFSCCQATVVQGIEQGNRALAALRQQLDVDDIADIMQDAADLQAWTDVALTVRFYLLFSHTCVGGEQHAGRAY